MSDAIEQARALVIQTVSDFTGSRYMTVISLALLLCDFLHYLPDNMVYVWPADRSMEKFAYIGNRLVVIFGILLANQSVGAFVTPMSRNVCTSVLITESICVVISMGLTDGLVSYYAWTLWDRNRRIGWCLFVAVLCTFVAAVAMMGHVAATSLEHVTYDANFKICVIDPIPRVLAGVYASGMVLEVVVFISTVFNVLDKPRKASAKLAWSLYRDGVLYFIAVIALRLTNTIMVLAVRSSLFYIVSNFIWVVLTVTINYLVLNQYSARTSFEHRLTMEAEDEAERSHLELGVLTPRTPHVARFG